jgi:hypothetical protein
MLKLTGYSRYLFRRRYFSIGQAMFLARIPQSIGQYPGITRETSRDEPKMVV